jgi:acyl-CoA synthetase (AMP-forming)/AMP-acid ligase II
MVEKAMSGAAMFDDAKSVWELIERRADASPDRVMLYDGDRETTFAQYKDMVEHAAAGLYALGIDADVNVSWQLPTWTESAALVGALCRLGAVQNPMLPIYRYREVSFIAKQTNCTLLITPSEWNRFDYAGLAQQVAGEQPGLHTLVADHWNPDGDPRPCRPRRRAPFAGRRPGAVDLLHVRHDRRAQRARTPIARCWRARSDTRRRRTSSSPTSPSSRSRSRTWAASSSGCSRRCSPDRPRC